MGYSRQRQQILRALENDRTHPTAAEVYARLRDVTPQLSLATVYRNLNSLAEKGRVRRIRVPGGADRFEMTPTEHDHLICQECGRVVDVPRVDLSGADERVEAATGAVVRGYTLTYEGICPECAGAQDGPSASEDPSAAGASAGPSGSALEADISDT